MPLQSQSTTFSRDPSEIQQNVKGELHSNARPMPHMICGDREALVCSSSEHRTILTGSRNGMSPLVNFRKVSYETDSLCAWRCKIQNGPLPWTPKEDQVLTPTFHAKSITVTDYRCKNQHLLSEAHQCNILIYSGFS